jgi:hypothetical protein
VEGKRISTYTDQAGNPVSKEHMFRMFSESMLANVLPFEAAGVPLRELKQAVGRDGGTIIGRGVVFQTPIQNRLSEDDAKQLIERYSTLVADYSKGQLDRQLINNVKLRNNVSTKINMIRSSEHLISLSPNASIGTPLTHTASIPRLPEGDLVFE